MKSEKSIYKNEILIAGEDYPRTFREFVTMFPNDKSCRKFLYNLRWKDGFFCPKCKASSSQWEQTHKRLVRLH